jgi:hypothetical protein
MLVLQMAAPGLMSAPAIAALLGLDVALTLASLIVSTSIAPFTATLFTHVFVGTALISPLGFAFKLLLLIAGSAAAAALVRRFLGREFLEREREKIDGLSVIGMLLFAIATMDGVTAHAIADPALIAGITLLTFVIALGMMAVTTLLFLRVGRGRALAIGLLAGNRNMGVMLTAIGYARHRLALFRPRATADLPAAAPVEAAGAAPGAARAGIAAGRRRVIANVLENPCLAPSSLRHRFSPPISRNWAMRCARSKQPAPTGSMSM